MSLTRAQRQVLMAKVLRDEGPGGKRSVLANTNMSASQSSPGKLMAARDNPTTSTRAMVSGPPEQDRDMPTGGNSPVSLGTSQPRGAATSQEFPLRHARTFPRRSR